MDGALKLQPVYSAVRILAEGVAMLPLQQFRDLGDRKQKMPLGQLLSKPSAFMNVFDWLFQYVSSAALQGTAWGLITSRDGFGYPTTIEWLPPEAMHVEDSAPFNPAKARIFYYGRPVSRDDLLIIRAFTIPGRTAGISPLKYFQMYVEAGHVAMDYKNGWFRGGGFPPGVFQNTEYEVTDEQSAKIRKKVVDAQRRREPLVTGRDWKYTPVTVPADEAQFVQSVQLNANHWAAIYGVAPHKIGGNRGDSLTYSNVESESISEVSDTLDPWLVRLETALFGCLPERQYARFNRNARLRTTAESRWNVYRTMRDIGANNIDGIRDLEDEPPLPKPRADQDFDGTDYTPLQVQVAAARGLKQEIGGPPGPGPEPGGPPEPAQHGPGLLAQFQPKPLEPAQANGNGKPRGG